MHDLAAYCADPELLIGHTTSPFLSKTQLPLRSSNHIQTL
jgi:hypothetical protein